mmetsp:Transcript_135637/g.306893  ORF Transcript_135637/g.306893 Transcript_135637/m.306893 type:complete len:216 (+) Transcript_135637:153-800(+)
MRGWSSGLRPDKNEPRLASSEGLGLGRLGVYPRGPGHFWNGSGIWSGWVLAGCDGSRAMRSCDRLSWPEARGSGCTFARMVGIFCPRSIFGPTSVGLRSGTVQLGGVPPAQRPPGGGGAGLVGNEGPLGGGPWGEEDSCPRPESQGPGTFDGSLRNRRSVAPAGRHSDTSAMRASRSQTFVSMVSRTTAGGRVVPGQATADTPATAGRTRWAQAL